MKRDEKYRQEVAKLSSIAMITLYRQLDGKLRA